MKTPLRKPIILPTNVAYNIFLRIWSNIISCSKKVKMTLIILHFKIFLVILLKIEELSCTVNLEQPISSTSKIANSIPLANTGTKGKISNFAFHASLKQKALFCHFLHHFFNEIWQYFCNQPLHISNFESCLKLGQWGWNENGRASVYVRGRIYMNFTEAGLGRRQI